MPKIDFGPGASPDKAVLKEVERFFDEVPTLEGLEGIEPLILQDGKSRSYYVRCSLAANEAASRLDLNAKLIPESEDSFRANRELLLDHNTYKKMRADAESGREFGDIIVEYNTDYSPERPLKVWGGQHRSKAIEEAFDTNGVKRFHGFRVHFLLTKEQRTELALVSNTNINISNDLFDRQLEETLVGPELRKWCQKVGLLAEEEDFPSQGSRSEKITTRQARTFIVNFHRGKDRGKELSKAELDKTVYQPYLCESGHTLDAEYERIVEKRGASLWKDTTLIEAARALAALHEGQQKAVKTGKGIRNNKGFRNKALTDSVLAAWSYVAGLLQNHPERLANHLAMPKKVKGRPDPLNASDMSNFKHAEDPATYRGLGTRAAMKDRERMAQVFLARSTAANLGFDKQLMNKAVSQVVGIKALEKGYS